jgi:peptidoglycan hydrolase CwlO-like protein
MKMKLTLFFTLLLVGCSSSQRVLDRTDSQKDYEKKEAINQERSLARSEIKMKITSLGSKIRAIDSQIANQRQVVKTWEAKTEVASSEAMVANAKVRIENLEREREILVEEQNGWKEKLE